MKIISKHTHHWQIECWDAAEAGETFFMENLGTFDVVFLKELQKKFPRPAQWGPQSTTLLFNPKYQPAHAGTVALSSS